MWTLASAFLLAFCLGAANVSAKRPDFIDDDLMDMIKDDKMECMNEHGTTEDVIEKAANGDIPNDPHITCYMACLFTRLGMMDDDGLDADMILSVMPDHLQEKGEKAFEKCAHLDGSDPCDKMYKISNCLYSTLPDLWFMV